MAPPKRYYIRLTTDFDSADFVLVGADFVVAGADFVVV